jgi:hypothetical protein
LSYVNSFRTSSAVIGCANLGMLNFSRLS